MEPNWTGLQIALALAFISISQGQMIKQARYESELSPPSKWPGYFFGSSPLNGIEGVQNFVCGVRCQLNDVGCGIFLVKDNTCYVGSRTNNLPSVIASPQTSNENVFVNPEHIDDLKPLFNSISGAQSSIEWLSTIDSYIDLPAGSVLNHCLYHCLFEESVCDIAVFENGRCHFGQLDGPKNATASQLIDPAGPWDLFFSIPYRTWYFGNNTWNSAFNSVGPRMSQHLFRWVFSGIEEMCALDCNFHTRYSSPCSFYAYNNVTQECYLGALNYTGNMFGEILWENVTVKALTDQKSSMVDYFISLPVKGYHVYNFLYKTTENTSACGLTCFLDPDKRCSFYVIASGFCHYGDVFQTNATILAPEIDPSDTHSMFINKDYAQPANVSDHFYTQVTLSFEVARLRLINFQPNIPTLETCAIACKAGYQHSSLNKLDMKCQFFIYNATTLNCHMGNLRFKSNDPPLENAQLTTLFVETAILEEISNGEDFSQEQFNPSWSSYIYHKATDSGTNVLQCGALCIFDTGPCNIAISDLITQACYLGDWYVNSTEFESVVINGGVSHRKPQLGVVLGGRDSTNTNLDTVDVIDEFINACQYPAIPNLITPLYSMGALYLQSDNQIAVCGGIHSIDPVDGCHILSLESDVPQWEPFKEYQEKVHNFRLAEVGDVLYGIAGKGEAALVSAIYEYAQSTDQWTFKINVPQAIEGHCSVVHDGEIWFMGGKTDTLPWPKDTAIYNPTTNIFRVPGTTGYLNVARLNPACGVVKDPKTNNDWIVVIGGKDEVLNSPLSSMEYFDVKEDQEWKILTTHVPSFETNVTVPLGGLASGGFIKFGPSRFMLISGSATDTGISESNLATWNEDIGQFHPITSTMMSAGRDLSSVVQIPLHTRWTCLPMGNEWVKMVEQNTDHFFQPLQLAGYPNTKETIISNLDTLELYKSCNDFYHLRLVWPELGFFNEWRQKSNFINPGPVLDYQAIAVRYPNFFGGLIHVNDNGKADGHPDHTYFKGDVRTSAQYAVGRYSNGPDGRIPGPVGNQGTGDIPITVDKIILYVKKDC